VHSKTLVMSLAAPCETGNSEKRGGDCDVTRGDVAKRWATVAPAPAADAPPTETATSWADC